MKRKMLSLLIVLTMLLTMIPVTASATALADINKHWAKDVINEWVENGFVSGYEDGTFKPENNITRAEFMVLVNNAFNFTEQSDTTYIDVPADAWYAQAVAIAKKAGYIGGYPDDTVKPNNPITRQEVAIIIAKLKELSQDTDKANEFVDGTYIADWSKGFVGAAAQAEIMSGYSDGTFKPTNHIKRAEAVVALNNALSYDHENRITYDKAGTYGPEDGKEILQKDVKITADGVILQNMVIQGDLFITEEVGDGDVTLKNVIVEGTTDVQGGGENSIHVIDSTLKNVKIFKKDGKIRIVLSGKSKADNVEANSGVKLEEKDLEGEGFQEIVIDAAEADSIVLVGNFDKLDIKAEGVKVELPKDTVVKELKVDEKAEITGKGTIEKAKINADGTKLEMTPTKEMTIKKGIEAKIEGKTEKGTGETKDMEEASKPSGGGGGGGSSSSSDEEDDGDTETVVSVTAITLTPQTMHLTAGGATRTITATVTPSNATNKNVTWSSSNDSVATVAKGVVTPVAAGTATITATSAADNSKKASCYVTVEEVVEADKSALIAVIATARNKVDKATVGTEAGSYSQSAVNALEQGIADAQAVVDNAEATQAKVDQATTALNAVIATFEAAVITPPQTYTLALLSNPSEGGTVLKEVYDRETGKETVTEAGYFKEGEQITVTATAKDGYAFVNWMEDDKEVSQNNAYTFDMPAKDLLLTANFDVLTVPVNTITIAGEGNAITVVEGETLQMSATVSPTDATNKNLTWSVENGTGSATISSTGLLTATEEGTVTVKATAQDGSGVVGTAAITVNPVPVTPSIPVTLQDIGISNENQMVISIYRTVDSEDSAIPSISIEDFTLIKDFGQQGEEEITGISLSTDPMGGTWEYNILPPSGETFADGIYRLAFDKTDYENEHISIEINSAPTGNIVDLTFSPDTYETGSEHSIDVMITTSEIPDGTSVGVSLLGPEGMTPVVAGPIAGTINNNTAIVGITAPDTLAAGSYYFEAKIEELTNYKMVVFEDPAPENEITAVAAIEDITVDHGTAIESVGLPTQVEVILENNTTTDLDVTWDTTSYDGNTAGTYALAGTLTLVEGIANTGNHKAAVKVIVNSLTVPVSSIDIIGDGDATTVVEGETLQMIAIVSPPDATNKNIAWSVENGTGSATISSTGLLTAIGEGTVTVKATAQDGSEVVGTAVITVNPAPAIESLAFYPDNNETGSEYIIEVRVTTSGIPDGTSVEVSLLGPEGMTSVVAGPITGTINNNAVVVEITVPATLLAGPYYFEAKIEELTSYKEVVFEDPDKEITVVTAIGDITVDYGTPIEAVGLPAQAEVTLEDSTTTDLDITWDITSYDGNTAGTYALEGTLTLVEGIANTGNYKAAVNVTVNANATPVATDDNASVNEDSTVLIDVLINDNDADGDMLEIASFTQGTNGTVSQEGPALRYTPDADFHGTDSFTYDISDGNGGTATGTVTVTINPINDSPEVVTGQGTQTGTATPAASSGEPTVVVYTADMSTWFEDVDNDPLTYTIVSALDESLNDISSDVNISGANITYTPAAAQAGQNVTIAVKANDGTDDSAGNVNITITVDAQPADALKEITGYTSLTAIALDADEYLVDLAALKASDKLPTQVEVTDGTTPVNASITDWIGTFDGTATGTATLIAVWDMPEGYKDDTDPIAVALTVNVNVMQTVDTTEADNAAILTAKNLLNTTATLNPVEGVNTNVVDMAQALVDAEPVAAGVVVSISDASGNENIGAEGAITYTFSEVTGNVVFALNKGMGTEVTSMMAVVVPAKPITPPEGDLLDADTGSSFTAVLYKKADGNIYYHQADAAGNWEGEMLIGTGTEGSMAVDASDNAHVVYTTSGAIGYRMYDGSAWTTEELIASNNAGSCSKPDIAVDGNGKAHITYTDTKGNTHWYTNKPDIMYATDATGSFTKTVIFDGYYESLGGADYLGVYYDKGSRITVNVNGDYFVATHQQDYYKSMSGADRTYSIQVKSNLGSGSTSTDYSDTFGIYDLNAQADKIVALYKQTGFKTSDLTVTGDTINFTNTSGIAGSTVSSVATDGTNVVVGGISSSNLQTHYNGGSHIYNDIVVKGTKVAVVNQSGIFYAVYADNSDGIIKKVEVVEPEPTYTLTLEANPAEGGTVTDNTSLGSYTAGTPVNVTATPNEGYAFVNWTVEDVEVSTTPNFDYTMPAANTTLKANFQLIIPGAEITVDNILQIGVNETAAASTTEAGAGGWTSDEPSIASIDPGTGVITAHSGGTATICYTTSDSGNVNCLDLEVYFPAQDVSEGLVFGDATTSISSGTKQLTGFPDQVNPDETRTFGITDSTTDIMTVDDNGLVTYVADGTKTIRYELKETATGVLIEWGEVVITAEPAPAPTVNFTDPADGAVVNRNRTTTTIQFNQNVTEMDLSGVSIIYSFNQTSTPVGNVVATVVAEDPRTINITHDTLPYNARLYTVTIPAESVQNAEGTANEEVTWSFRTSPIIQPRSMSFSNTDDSATVTVTELYDENGQDNLADFINDDGSNFDVKFQNSGEGTYSVTVEKNGADIVITNPSTIEQASDDYYDLAIYRISDEYSWFISLTVTTDPQIELSTTTFSKSDSSASFSVPTLVDHLGDDVQYDLVQDNGTAFSYELTDGTSSVTVTNSGASSTLNIADPSQAVDIGTYTLTITRNSDGIQWTAAIDVTE